MEEEQLAVLRRQWPRHAAKVRVLEVPDEYVPTEPALREVLEERIRRLLADLL